MIIGNLRHRVSIYQPAAGVDAIGQPTVGFTLVEAGVFADVRYLSGLEAIQAGMDVSTVKASILMRNRAMTAGMQINFGSEIFRVKAVLHDPRRRAVTAVCEVSND